MSKLAMVAVWIILITILSIIGMTLQEDSIHEIGPESEAYFCQTDNCSSYLINLVKNAEKSVHCAFFDIDLYDLKNTLANASRYIDVKLVIDNDNYEGIKGNIKYDDSSQYMHNKFCVFDRKIVWTGSFNPTERGNSKNDNNAIMIHSRKMADNFEQEFNELWNGIFGKGEKNKRKNFIINNITISNHFCPEDDCAKRIINEIKRAEHSVYFMTFSFTHEEIADTILSLKDVDIKGIFEKSQAGNKYSQYQRLKGFGIDVIKDSNPFNMHHKVFIIDNRTVITGSMNPTKNGNQNNDENILIIEDERIASQYLMEFKRLWS